jgi:hypothetical protein
MLGQASESVEGEERDGMTAMTTQGFLSMAVLAGMGFGSKLADYRFEINLQLWGRESFARMLSQPSMTSARSAASDS